MGREAYIAGGASSLVRDRGTPPTFPFLAMTSRLPHATPGGNSSTDRRHAAQLECWCCINQIPFVRELDIQCDVLGGSSSFSVCPY